MKLFEDRKYYCHNCGEEFLEENAEFIPCEGGEPDEILFEMCCPHCGAEAERYAEIIDEEDEISEEDFFIAWAILTKELKKD